MNTMEKVGQFKGNVLKADTQVLKDAVGYYGDVIANIKAMAKNYPGTPGIEDEYYQYATELIAIEYELIKRGEY